MSRCVQETCGISSQDISSVASPTSLSFSSRHKFHAGPNVKLVGVPSHTVRDAAGPVPSEASTTPSLSVHCRVNIPTLERHLIERFRHLSLDYWNMWSCCTITQTRARLLAGAITHTVPFESLRVLPEAVKVLPETSATES